MFGLHKVFVVINFHLHILKYICHLGFYKVCFTAALEIKWRFNQTTSKSLGACSYHLGPMERMKKTRQTSNEIVRRHEKKSQTYRKDTSTGVKSGVKQSRQEFQGINELKKKVILGTNPVYQAQMPDPSKAIPQNHESLV